MRRLRGVAVLGLLALPSFLALLLFPPSFLLQGLSHLLFGLAGPLLLTLDSAWPWRSPPGLSPTVDEEGGGERGVALSAEALRLCAFIMLN